MRTVIARKDNGEIIDIFEELATFGGLNPELEAKDIDCTGKEKNISEIPGWSSAHIDTADKMKDIEARLDSLEKKPVETGEG